PREVERVVHQRVLGERIDQPVIGPRRQQILPVLRLRLGQIVVRGRQSRIARRKIQRQLLERLGSVVVPARLVFRHGGNIQLVGRWELDRIFRIEWGRASQRCREQQGQQK